jgi:hypothetical protein
VQFLRFGPPREGGEEAVLEAHAAAVESCRASYPAFEAAFLVRLEDGDWLDVSVWDRDTGADGGTGFPPLEARADFVSQLDGLLGDENGLLVRSFIGSSLRCD